MLQPLDLLLALKIAVNEKPFTQTMLGYELNVSVSQINRALNSCAKSGLVDRKNLRVSRLALFELISHAVKYIYPVSAGPIERGMPTAYAASPLKELMGDNNDTVVWPDPEGEVRGESVKPLYKTAPFAAQRDEKLYEALALIDALRIGRARERNIAVDLLNTMLVGVNDGSK